MTIDRTQSAPDDERSALEPRFPLFKVLLAAFAAGEVASAVLTLLAQG